MITITGDPFVLKKVPNAIDKKRHKFLARVLRKYKPKSFAELIIGESFRLLTDKVKPHEKQLILKKIKASAHDNNAVVITTFYPNTNPCGQLWTVDAACAVEKESS